MRLWDIEDLATEIDAVQRWRANPPYLAGGDERRRDVFQFAIRQFAELLGAASSLPSSVSPIPTFYALSQAGRAVAAARKQGDDWELGVHGLTVFATPEMTLGDVQITPRAVTYDAAKQRKADAVSVVAAATGSACFERAVTITELWASLPTLERVGELGLDRPGPLLVHARTFPEIPDHRVDSGGIDVHPEVFGPHGEGVEGVLNRYPQAAGYEVLGRTHFDHLGTVRVWLKWPTEDDDRPLDEFLESFGDRDAFYLRPDVGAHTPPPSILMTEWALLLALSSVARYHPGLWGRAIDYDGSGLAVPLDQGLTKLQLLMPRLVLHALHGVWPRTS